MSIQKEIIKYSFLFSILPLMVSDYSYAQSGFTDVTSSVGLSGLADDVASWVDYNSDGWVDLFC